VTNDHVEVKFFPTAPSDDESESWRLTIAAQLRNEPGAATAIFVTRDRGWRFSSLLWYPPHAGRLETASERECAPLRTKIFQALKQAGKAVEL
jgi:hypothetical protein